MEIVKAKVEHADGIVDLWVGLMDYHWELNPFHKLREGATKNWGKYLENMMEREDAIVLVALDGNERPVGYIIGNVKEYPPIFWLENYGFISDMFISDEFRGSGLGKRMVEDILRWFDKHDLERIELRVEPLNDLGYGFWKSQGFKTQVHVMAMDR